MKDIDFNFKIGEENELAFITKNNVKGFLESFKLYSNDVISFDMRIILFPNKIIDEESTSCIYKNISYFGHQLIFPRKEALAEDNTLLNYSREKILLNDKILIIIKGKKDTDIKIQMRLS